MILLNDRVRVSFQAGVRPKADLILLLLLLLFTVQGSVQRYIIAHWRSGQEE